MKKTIIVSACVAAFLCAQSFAENATGKITGISVTDSTATVTIAEGVVDPFSNEGFTASGKTITETIPLDTAVQFFVPAPKRAKAPSAKEESKTAKKAPARPENTAKAVRPQFPKLSVKQLHIDQLVSFVYAEDDTSVEKILIQAPKLPQVAQGKHPAKTPRQPAAQNKRTGTKR